MRNRLFQRIVFPLILTLLFLSLSQNILAQQPHTGPCPSDWQYISCACFSNNACINPGLDPIDRLDCGTYNRGPLACAQGYTCRQDPQGRGACVATAPPSPPTPPPAPTTSITATAQPTTTPTFQSRNCRRPEDTILKISSYSGGLAETWEPNNNYPIGVCFNWQGTGNPHECTRDYLLGPINNLVLKLSAATNAHAAGPDKSSPYTQNVCYKGYENCKTVPGENCPTDAPTAVVKLSGDTNAHVVSAGTSNPFGENTKTVCCKTIPTAGTAPSGPGGSCQTTTDCQTGLTCTSRTCREAAPPPRKTGGEECASSNECESQYCADPDGDEVSTCQVAKGERCSYQERTQRTTPEALEKDLTADERLALFGTNCGLHKEGTAEYLLYCGSDGTCGGKDAFCDPKQTDEKRQHPQCSSLSCQDSFSCDAPPRPGTRCEQGQVCVGGQPCPENRQCSPLAEGDGPCQNNAECITGYCDPATNTCIRRPAGESCTTTPECQTGLDCISGTCQTVQAPPGDTDNDGRNNNEDNCPTVANPGQDDTDNNGVGDACETVSEDGQTDVCTADSDCEESLFCNPDLGTCDAPTSFNNPCTDNTQCASGTCNEDDDGDGIRHCEAQLLCPLPDAPDRDGDGVFPCDLCPDTSPALRDSVDINGCAVGEERQGAGGYNPETCRGLGGIACSTFDQCTTKKTADSLGHYTRELYCCVPTLSPGGTINIPACEESTYSPVLGGSVTITRGICEDPDGDGEGTRTVTVAPLPPAIKPADIPLTSVVPECTPGTEDTVEVRRELGGTCTAPCSTPPRGGERKIVPFITLSGILLNLSLIAGFYLRRKRRKPETSKPRL